MSHPVPDDIVSAAQDAMGQWKVPASVSIAQWALESGWGAKTSGAFNYFGIKARPGEPCTTVATHEVVHGQRIEIMAAFRDFASVADAFDRHAELLATAPVYAPAMGALPDVEAFVRLMAGHYATDPNYASLILSIIKGGDMQRFDQ